MNRPNARVAISVVRSVDADARRAVLCLAAAARLTDGTDALNDQVRFDLEYPDQMSTHLLARLADSDVVGYAHLRRTEFGPASAHVVVSPDHRRHGVATALVERLVEEAGPTGLRVWAHGDEAAARLLSGRLGFVRVRDLWKMTRSLTEPLPAPAYPGDVTVRMFVPGKDEDAWLEVNARAFAGHPEQGAVTSEDLQQLMRQPWFDPAGFFVVERAGRLVGFHWTKVHPETNGGSRGYGEVYVVGVDPWAQGLGLGKALTLTGLHYLRDLGLDSCILYVEADNGPAVAVYEKLGFTTASLDVMYERR